MHSVYELFSQLSSSPKQHLNKVDISLKGKIKRKDEFIDELRGTISSKNDLLVTAFLLLEDLAIQFSQASYEEEIFELNTNTTSFK